MSDIKSGYLLKITTWENDADNFETKELEGLTENEVNFYLHLASLFRSENDIVTIGNEDILSDEELPDKIQEYLTLYSRHKVYFVPEPIVDVTEKFPGNRSKKHI